MIWMSEGPQGSDDSARVKRSVYITVDLRLRTLLWHAYTHTPQDRKWRIEKETYQLTAKVKMAQVKW